MTSDLLTPATEALLAGWRGPVEILTDHVAYVVLGSPCGTGQVLLASCTTPTVTLWAHPDSIRLDLSRAECRDRAARVLAERQAGKPCPNGVRLAVAQGTVGAILILHTEHGPEWCYPRSGYPDQSRVGAEILAHAHPEALALRLCLEATRG